MNLRNFIANNRSRFMSDATEGHREGVLDFELSWAIRSVANKDVKIKQPLLYHQCHTILMSLLDNKNRLKGKNIKLKFLKVEKQYKQIDLLISIVLKVDDIEERHVILIENKAYSSLRKHQLEDYPKRAEYHMQKTNEWTDYTLHKYVIHCGDPEDDNDREYKEICQGTDWIVIPFTSLLDQEDVQLTESDLFNEFWLTNWNLETDFYTDVDL